MTHMKFAREARAGAWINMFAMKASIRHGGTFELLEPGVHLVFERV